MEPRIREIADELAGSLFAQGSPADLVTRYARQLPLWVICELLGLPLADRPKFIAWAGRATSIASIFSLLRAAPALAAIAFASMMAFEEGGIVPGVTKGDSQMAMLTPGEGVIPKPVMEKLSASSSDGSQSQIHQHTHKHSWNITAMDAEGFERVLQRNSDVVEKHVNNHFRKMGH